MRLIGRFLWLVITLIAVIISMAFAANFAMSSERVNAPTPLPKQID